MTETQCHFAAQSCETLGVTRHPHSGQWANLPGFPLLPRLSCTEDRLKPEFRPDFMGCVLNGM